MVGEKAASPAPPNDPEQWELLRIFDSMELAEDTRDFLRAIPLPCALLDRRVAPPEVLGEAAAGVWLKVPRERRAEAEARLAERDEESGKDAGADVRCTSCDSTDFGAVTPSQSPSGSWWLRCQNCGRRTPVAEADYLSDTFPILPAACPACGSFRVTEADPPPRDAFDMQQAEDGPWWACENCEHRWPSPREAKGPGTAAAGGSAEPSRRHDLEAVPQEIAEAPPEEPSEASPEDDGDTGGPQCPRCLSRHLSMNDVLVAKGGPVRFLCTACGEVWDQAFPAGAPLPDLPVVRDGDAVAEAGIHCAQCGSRETESCEPPPFAGESALGLLFKRFLGARTWHRCLRCGFQWEG